MTRTERIEAVKKTLRAALELEDDHAIRRFAMYKVAEEILEGRIRGLVWTEPPFPEVGDKRP